MAWKINDSIAALSFALLFIACGDDNGNSVSIPEKQDVVSSLDKLNDCTLDIEGDTVYVRENKTDYICQDGEWTPITDTEESSSSKMKSSSSKKIESSSSKEKTASSSSNKEEASCSSQDGKDVVSSSSSDASSLMSSSVYIVKQDTSDDIPKVINIGGIAQKGPFVEGSTIELFAMNKKSLKIDTDSFTGKVTGNDGSFKLMDISKSIRDSVLKVYPVLKVSGKYRNEINGQISSNKIELKALDGFHEGFSGTKVYEINVNVNLLTHLEYERDLKLMESGMLLGDAQEQARNEICSIFGFDCGWHSFSGIDIFDLSDGKYLLAISVLLLNDFSEAEFIDFLDNLAEDIASDGKWDDEVSRARIADWASEQDLSGGLDTIHNNIAKWNLGAVPEFEKYVRSFWYANYGLDSCYSDNKNKVMAVTNKHSVNYGTQIRYICKDNAWVVATDIEKDTCKWQNGYDGDFKRGDVTGRMYKYDRELGEWQYATERDSVFDYACVTSREGDNKKVSGSNSYYVCNQSEWRLDADAEKCENTDVGRVSSGDSSSNKYYCSENGWISMSRDWSWDVPLTARLNPEITYEYLVDSRDNQSYRIVTIGGKTWMAENLNYADSVTMSSLKGKSWCPYDLPENCQVGGRLYTWAAAIDSVKWAMDESKPMDCGYKGTNCVLPALVQGICPEGWHLPNRSDWTELLEAVGGESTAGNVLKSQTGWSYEYGGLRRDNDDAYGFCALPIGSAARGEGAAVNDGYEIYFWLSEADGPTHAWNAAFVNNTEKGRCVGIDKSYGHSVRCIKD